MTWDELRALRHKNVHIVGLSGVEGSAVADFLIRQGFTNLTAHDFRPAEDFDRNFRLVHVGMKPEEREAALQRLKQAPLRICFQDHYLDGILEADAIFATQAWFIYQCNLPKLRQAKDKGIPFYSMTMLYFDLAPCPILAVTGTNGKSTTSKLLSEIVAASGRRTYYAGNERRSVQVLDRLEEMRPDDVLVLEVSNRQLIELERSPHVAVVTNVTPNHLDEHEGSFEKYVATKERLVRYQRPGDIAVLNYDNLITRRMAERTPGHVVYFSREVELAEGAFLRGDRLVLRRGGEERELCRAQDLLIPGEHNISNVLAAALAAFMFGVPPEVISRTVRTFRGLRHRLQLVYSVDGVRYYDDLNSTTPQATVAALKALDAPVVLIAGGEDKGLSFDEVAALAVQRCRLIILLPGRGTDRLEEALRAARRGTDCPPIQRAAALEEAVVLARTAARPGDVVLLSPACPYFFSRFYDDSDGAGFRALVRRVVVNSRPGSPRSAGATGADMKEGP